MSRETGFKSAVSSFPAQARQVLSMLPAQGGALTWAQVQELLQKTGWTREELMVRLLPLARVFAVAPVSNFRVGAVVEAGYFAKEDKDVFVGANQEFLNQPLNMTIHAEQAALINAYFHGAGEITALAVTDPPCGLCRQFLAEYGDKAKAIKVITLDHENGSFASTCLEDLLPGSFGPQNLGNQDGLSRGGSRKTEIKLEIPTIDPLAVEALAAAVQSYAPYTHNLAGCALELETGRTVSGGHVENAAFNPSLSPLHTALIRLNLGSLKEEVRINRAVLVEKTTIISQKPAVEPLLHVLAPQVELEYYGVEG